VAEAVADDMIVSDLDDELGLEWLPRISFPLIPAAWAAWSGPSETGRGVEPVLVCQVALVKWTDGDKLRHCTLLGCGMKREGGEGCSRGLNRMPAPAPKPLPAREERRAKREARSKCRSDCHVGGSGWFCWHLPGRLLPCRAARPRIVSGITPCSSKRSNSTPRSIPSQPSLPCGYGYDRLGGTSSSIPSRPPNSLPTSNVLPGRRRSSATSDT
jgi:hypothetical protein